MGGNTSEGLIFLSPAMTVRPCESQLTVFLVSCIHTPSMITVNTKVATTTDRMTRTGEVITHVVGACVRVEALYLRCKTI